MRDSVEQAPTGGTARRRLGYLALALLIHIAGGAIYVLLPGPAGPQPVVRAMPTVPVRLAESSAAVQAARQARQAALRKAAVPPPPHPIKPRPEPAVRGIVVDVPPAPDGRPPEVDTEFLAERNAHTDHETRSRQRSPDYQNVMHERSTQEVAETAAPAKAPATGADAFQAGRAAQAPAAKALPAARTQAPRQSARDRLALHIDPTLGALHNQKAQADLPGDSESLQLSPQNDQAASAEADPQMQAGAPGRGLTMADLIPSVGALSRLPGGPSNDALEGVEAGEGTFLNAREYKYAAYFGRVKRGVSQYWRPSGEFARRDPTGEIYGHRDHTTAVQVTLGAAGDVSHIRLARSSGVEFLDKQALQAFSRAAPFPNPPRGLLNAAGEFTFQFSFVLEFGGRSAFETPY
jgi:TonB family protein